MEKFDQIAYISAYNEATYDRLTLRIPKGQKKVIQDRAAEKGMSVNAYITALIKKTATSENLINTRAAQRQEVNYV